MLFLKDLSKEVLSECKARRPNEFKYVTESDVYQVMLIIHRNIAWITKTYSLLAIKDFFLFRPNLKKLIKKKLYLVQRWEKRSISDAKDSIEKG